MSTSGMQLGHEYNCVRASPAEWKSNNIQCSGTGGTTLSQSGGTLSNNGVEYDYPTNYIGSWMASHPQPMAHGPKRYGYDAASCRVACKEYKWIGLQNGGYCTCRKPCHDLFIPIRAGCYCYCDHCIVLILVLITDLCA